MTLKNWQPCTSPCRNLQQMEKSILDYITLHGGSAVKGLFYKGGRGREGGREGRDSMHGYTDRGARYFLEAPRSSHTHTARFVPWKDKFQLPQLTFWYLLRTTQLLSTDQFLLQTCLQLTNSSPTPLSLPSTSISATLKVTLYPSLPPTQ